MQFLLVWKKDIRGEPGATDTLRGDTDGRGPTAAHRIRTRSDAMTHVVAPAVNVSEAILSARG